MKVLINGEPHRLQDGLTLAQIVAQLLVPDQERGVAVALNDEVVLRGQWAKTVVASGDRIEIIHAVQGG